MADEQQGPERHINIHFEPKHMAGKYANFANVSHSDYEFTITFARVDHEVEDDEIPGVVVVAHQPLAALHARAASTPWRTTTPSGAPARGSRACRSSTGAAGRARVR